MRFEICALRFHFARSLVHTFVFFIPRVPSFFVRSAFARSFVHSFVLSFARSFVGSVVRSFVRS